MNPSELMAQIAGANGFAKPTRWRISLNAGQVVAQNGQFATAGVDDPQLQRRLEFFCDQTELPGRAFGTYDVRHYGPVYKQPFVSAYPDVNLRFLVGHDMAEKYFFDAWMFTIEQPDTQNFAYLKDYVTQIWIDQLSETTGEPTYRCILYDAWPIAMDKMMLDYSATDTPHRLTMAFTYRRWVDSPFDVEGSSASAQLGIEPISFNPK